MWRRDEPKTFERPDGSTRIFGSRHEGSGFKAEAPTELRHKPVQDQLDYWVNLLDRKPAPLSELNSRGWEFYLDGFVGSGQGILLPTEMASVLAELGVGVEFSFSDV